MPIKRSYAEHGDACATAHAIELIGDRWTYPVLRELLLAPKRFRELQASVIGVTPAVLTTRLREMEAAGLVERTTLPPPASVTVYRLTPWARELDPVFRTLGQWAHGSPAREHVDGGLTPDGVVLSMLTMAPQTPPTAAPLELQLDLADRRAPNSSGYRYRLTWDAAGIRIERGEHPQAAATLRTDSSDLAGMLYATHSLPTDDGVADVDGDRAAVEHLLSAFPTV